MKAIEEKELKQIQLEILCDVAAFCEKHGLRYYLAYGTLLGAVRHKGYIPWDDDIDIHMPRPDYEKFISLYNNEIIDNCDKIKHIEHVIDSIYSDYISNLFKGETDYIELVKNKNIAETFESASDVLKNVSDTIRTIVIKNS